MDNFSWRSSLAHDSRQKIVKRIMDTLQQHMPTVGQDGVDELLKLAWRFEEKIFQAATDQQDYFDKISVKMTSLETKANRNPLQRPASGLPGAAGGAPGVPGVPGFGASQMRNVAGLGNVIQLGTQNQQHLQQQQQQQLQQLQQQHQFLTQSLQANGASGIQTTVAGLTPNSPGVASVSQNPMAGIGGQVMNSTVMSNRLQQMQQQRQAVQHQQVSQQQQSNQQQQLLYQQQQQQRMQQHQAAILKQKMQIQQQQQQQLPLQHQQQLPLQHQQHQSLQHQVSSLNQQQQPVNQLLVQSNAALQQQQQLLQQQLLQSKQQQIQHQVQQQQQQQTTTSTLSQQPQQLQPIVQQPGQQGQLGQQRHGSNQQSQQRIGQSGGLHQQHQQQQQQQQANMSLQAQQQQANMPLQAQQQHAIPEHPTASVESSAQSGPAGSGAGNVDQRELVWTKLQLLKDKYLQDMTDLFRMLSDRSIQPMPAEQLQKLKHYKDVLQRMIPYLRVPKDRVPKEFNQDKVDAFEKQIVSIMETFKRRRQPQPAAPGGPAPPAPPPAPQAVAQPVPVQHPDQVNVAQAPQPQPPQMPQNRQPVLQIPSNNQGIQSVQQQQKQQQQLLSQMQQEKQIQHQQLMGVGSQATGSMILPTNNAQSSLQHIPGILQQTLAGTPLQSTVVPTSQPVGAAMPTSSTGLIGQNGLTGLSANSNVPGNATQSGMNLPQPDVVSAQFGVNTYQQSPNNTLQQNGGSVTSLPSQNNAIQQQMLKQQQEQQLQAQHTQQQHLVQQQALLQPHNLKQRQMNQQQFQQQPPHKIGPPQLVPSPQISQVVSPQSDQAFKATPMHKTGTPPQTFRIPSPSTLSATPATQDEVDHKGPTPVTNSTMPCTMQALQTAIRSTGPINTPGMSVSPLMENTLSPSPGQLLTVHDSVQTFSPGTPLIDRTISTEPPLEQLKKKVDSMPKEILKEAVNELNDVVSCGDKLGGSAPGTGSRAAIGEDLSAKTRSTIQARAISQDTSDAAMKRRRVDSIAVNMISADGTISNALHRPRYNTDIGNHMVSHINSPLLKITARLEEEIRYINSRLIDTVVEVSTEATEENAAQGRNGVVLSCCYKGNALSPNVSYLRAKEYAPLSRTSLYLTVLPTYPAYSPHIWFDSSNPQANHHCFRGAQEDFMRSLLRMDSPLSLATIATSWDECARKSLTEYARQHGGGNFTTAYGAWETAHQIACKSVS